MDVFVERLKEALCHLAAATVTGAKGSIFLSFSSFRACQGLPQPEIITANNS